jgi:acetyltransferase
MQLLIEYAKSEGLKQIFGQVLRENTTMIEMCRSLGFKVEADPTEHDLFDVTLPLER